MSSAAQRQNYTFFHSLRVRWAEVDPQGIVFNGNYLTYLDVATTEYYRQLGMSYPADLLRGGGDLFAVKSTLEYRARRSSTTGWTSAPAWRGWGAAAWFSSWASGATSSCSQSASWSTSMRMRTSDRASPCRTGCARRSGRSSDSRQWNQGLTPSSWESRARSAA